MLKLEESRIFHDAIVEVCDMNEREEKYGAANTIYIGKFEELPKEIKDRGVEFMHPILVDNLDGTFQLRIRVFVR